MNSGTRLRGLTAVILIPGVCAAVWWGPNWLIAALAAIVAILALREFFTMGEHAGFHPYRIWSIVATLGIFAQQAYAVHWTGVSRLQDLLYRAHAGDITLELVLFIFVLGMAAIVLESSRPLADVFSAVSVSVAGVIVIALPFSAVVRLHGVQVIGPRLLLFTLVLVWVGDTAAYFVGRNFGRLKLAPHLSPNKTWEGAAANLFGSLLVGVLFGRWMKIPVVHMLAMASFGSIAGQVGDIFESAFKRSAGVKDSGTILPGHGGMLDRIDALILAAPAVWYYFEWVVMRKF